MRTYLQARELIPGPGPGAALDLVMTCNCGKEVKLTEFVDRAVRPLRIGSINLLRLMEWIGKFASEHAACPDLPPAPPDA